MGSAHLGRVADVLSFTSPKEEPFTTYEHNCIVELIQQSARHFFKLFCYSEFYNQFLILAYCRTFREISVFPFLEDIKYGHVPI